MASAEEMMAAFAAMQAELQTLRGKVEAMPLGQPPARPTGERSMEIEDDDLDDLVEDQGEVPHWGLVLTGLKLTPSSPDSALLTALLVTPPPLGQIADIAKSASQFAGLPETPTPRKNMIDRSYWTIQHKLDITMNMMIQYTESGDKQHFAQAAALVRSAWEDCHQTRRRVYAGKGKSTLPVRPDDTRPRLLTTEEEEKARRASRRPIPTNQITQSTVQQWRPKPQQWRSPSNSSRPKGKGKGKGQPRDQK